MTSIVTDFKSIARKLNRQEQKAEFEAKNPEPAMYGWPYAWRQVNTEPLEYAIQQGQFGDEFVKLSDGTCLHRAIKI